jgi:hypothetical protein
VVILAMATAVPLQALAGPCTVEIERLQAQVDARIDSTAGAGPVARESTAALDHHQPTPESLAGAERRLDEGAAGESALAALARARKADVTGDAVACESAIAAARNALGQ